MQPIPFRDFFRLFRKQSRDLKLYSPGVMAELFSGEMSHFFGGQLGEAEDMLALIEDRWVAGKK